MCILFFYINPNPVAGSYRLVIASNRDEVYSRPSMDAHQWSTNPDIYGGIDLQPGKEGGAWLAMNRKGRIGILLNVGQNREVQSVDEKSGRGFYVVDFLSQLEKETGEIFESIKQSCTQTSQPFKLVTFDLKNNNVPLKCSVLSRVTDPAETFAVEHFPSGVYGMGNNLPNLTWNKVQKGQETLSQIVQGNTSWDEREKLIEELLQMLNCRDRYWPDSGILEQMDKRPAAVLECLSSVFVDIPVAKYGTRSQTIILVDYDNNVVFYERSLVKNPEEVASGSKWKENRFEFQLDL